MQTALRDSTGQIRFGPACTQSEMVGADINYPITQTRVTPGLFYKPGSIDLSSPAI